MRYCTRCLYPKNHPLGITFDDDGVCSGCRVHEEKDALKWRERLQILKDLCLPYKSKKKAIHDCIIPVTGARDSYFIVHVVKNILGMHPLLVNYNRQYNTHVGIRNIAYLRTMFGCDFMQVTVSPDRVKMITNETIRLIGSMYWHCLAGQTSFPVQIAVKYKIPLIIWGAHQGVDQVGMFSHLDEVEMTRKYRKDHDLMGLEAEDLLASSSELSRADLQQFFYPHDKEIEAVGIRGVYLGNYIRWDSKAQHELMIKTYGYEAMAQLRTFDTYNDVDCFHYSGLHDYIKFLKWGYGKVTDHACREIRLKRLTREQGIELVKRYQDTLPQDAKLFFDWLKMHPEKFWAHIDAHRDPAIWSRRANDRWQLRDSVTRHTQDPGVTPVRLDLSEGCEFQRPPLKQPELAEDHYVLVGRGHVDGYTPPNFDGTGTPLVFTGKKPHSRRNATDTAQK
jgi:N-acetyl sugar amidotransferase